MIKLNNVTVSFQKDTILENINLQVKQGESEPLGNNLNFILFDLDSFNR